MVTYKDFTGIYLIGEQRIVINAKKDGNGTIYLYSVKTFLSNLVFSDEELVPSQVSELLKDTETEKKVIQLETAVEEDQKSKNRLSRVIED